MTLTKYGVLPADLSKEAEDAEAVKRAWEATKKKEEEKKKKEEEKAKD